MVPKVAHALSIAGATLLCACGSSSGSDQTRGSAAPVERAAPSAAPASTGAPGAGDKTGRERAHAKALTKEAPASFDLACKEAIYFGPFRFRGDKDEIELTTEIKSATGEQVCGGGEWQDEQGSVVAPAGLGCTEGTTVTKGGMTLDYDPKSGGLGANPVYLKVTLAEVPCAAASVTLRLP
jgi:hypothetical protein